MNIRQMSPSQIAQVKRLLVDICTKQKERGKRSMSHAYAINAVEAAFIIAGFPTPYGDLEEFEATISRIIPVIHEWGEM